jgi:hypothetical protein
MMPRTVLPPSAGALRAARRRRDTAGHRRAAWSARSTVAYRDRAAARGCSACRRAEEEPVMANTTVLPFSTRTATGDGIDVRFPLHPATVSVSQTAELLTRTLETVTDAVTADARYANGDVLQSLAMALAVRATMIHAPPEVTAQLARELLETALAATHDASGKGGAGHA